MGSSGSKQNAASPSSPSPSPPRTTSLSSVRRARSYRSRVFQSSCLRSRHHSHNAEPQVSDNETKRNKFVGPCGNDTVSDSNEVKSEWCRKNEVRQPDELNCATSNTDNDEWDQSRGGCMSSLAFSSQGLTPSSRFLSRLNIFPGNVSISLNRANSLGSARPYFASSVRFPMSNNEDEPSTFGNRSSGDDRVYGRDLIPSCINNQSSISPPEDIATGNFLQITSPQGALRDRVDAGVNSNENSFSGIRTYTEGTEERLASRRIAAGDTVEQNVRFSRTLSVGRLRDRVLRRTSFPEIALGSFEQDRQVGEASQVREGQILGARTKPTSTVQNAFSSPASSIQAGPEVSSSLYGHGVDTPRPREARYHDLLEYRSNFLERRRRIRSQVRALQCLGSRFENLSGHERSCVLSGQHRRGHCTCRTNPRDANSNNETSARASISRIVMLAEALFEVLDEIHQQSVVLSSQPSTSSLVSVPAPIEVVESLPLRFYSKLQKHLHGEVAQCYICLVEYEEGDSVRVLPCHHEYHKLCIDKWLKEIHRVCPLCRGDVCRSDSFPENI